jgi:stearoyl-CoA desaturase (delta-9 desaturase)
VVDIKPFSKNRIWHTPEIEVLGFMIILAFFLGHWYLSLFFQTFFLHRYAAHAMFKMSRFWEKVFFVFSWLFQGSSYLSPYAYGVLHRLHHAHTDTEKDPHSPSYDDNLFKMMWRTKEVYSDIYHEELDVEQPIGWSERFGE